MEDSAGGAGGSRIRDQWITQSRVLTPRVTAGIVLWCSVFDLLNLPPEPGKSCRIPIIIDEKAMTTWRPTSSSATPRISDALRTWFHAVHAVT
jgi:hypothetical protein